MTLIIRKQLRESLLKLTEDKQLADKIYFKTGKLSEEDKNVILSITNGDNYTKILCDFYYYLKENSVFINQSGVISELNKLYKDVKTYNKNVFPIAGFDVYKPQNISNIIDALNNRRRIINLINKLPSIAIRNLKQDIRKERNGNELQGYLHSIEYFMGNVSYLSNRDEEIKTKILKKMFKSNTTIDDLMKFTDDKANFLGGVEFTKDDVKKLSESEDIEVIYDQNNVMIVRVDSAHGIKAIGCNSLWCFTYGSAYEQASRDWSKFSYNDMVYVLIDFNQKSDSESFMYTLIKPLTDERGRLIKYGGGDEFDENDVPLYNMSNENYENPYSVLNHFFGKNYKKIIKDYLNFDY